MPKNLPAPLCMPLHCTAFDCDGEDARTPQAVGIVAASLETIFPHPFRSTDAYPEIPLVDESAAVREDEPCNDSNSLCPSRETGDSSQFATENAAPELVHFCHLTT